MYFHNFVINSPWERAGPFIWTNLNSLHQRMLCAKFGWNWLSGSGEEDFLISSMFFFAISYICNYLPLEKSGALHLNKLESLFPRMLCAKFGWNWPSGSREEDFLISSMFFYAILYICNYLPLEKSGALYLNKLEFPLPKDALCQVEIGPVVLEKKIF